MLLVYYQHPPTSRTTPTTTMGVSVFSAMFVMSEQCRSDLEPGVCSGCRPKVFPLLAAGRMQGQRVWSFMARRWPGGIPPSSLDETEDTFPKIVLP